MKHFLPFAIVLSLLFSSCAPAIQPLQPTSIPTQTPTATATATPIPTATETLAPTATPTPKGIDVDTLKTMSDEEKMKVAPPSLDGYTPSYTFKDTMVVYKDDKGTVQNLYDLATGEWKTTKEAGYITLSDWEKMYAGTEFIGDDGKVYDIRDSFFGGHTGKILEKPEDAKKIKFGSSIMVLNPSGLAEVYVDPNDAYKKALNGAIIYVSNNWFVSVENDIFLEVAKDQYKKGNSNLKLEIGSAKNDKILGGHPEYYGFPINIVSRVLMYNNSGLEVTNIMQVLGDNNVTGITTPVMLMPDKFFVSRSQGELGNELTDDLKSQISKDPENWLYYILKAGYYYIKILPWASQIKD